MEGDSAKGAGIHFGMVQIGAIYPVKYPFLYARNLGPEGTRTGWRAEAVNGIVSVYRKAKMKMPGKLPRSKRCETLSLAETQSTSKPWWKTAWMSSAAPALIG
jgi:hypothetical protein